MSYTGKQHSESKNMMTTFKKIYICIYIILKKLNLKKKLCLKVDKFHGILDNNIHFL